MKQLAVLTVSMTFSITAVCGLSLRVVPLWLNIFSFVSFSLVSYGLASDCKTGQVVSQYTTI